MKMTAKVLDKQYKGAVFFDVDGTLVDERKKIYKPTAATKSAIKKLRETDWLVGIATGRSKCYIPDMGIDFNCYASCNGAVAEIDNRVIFNDCISSEEILKLSEYFEKNRIAYDIETRDVCYYDENRADLLEAIMKVFHIESTAFTPYKPGTAIAANKMMIAFDRDEQFEEIKSALSDKYQVIRHHKNNSADIMRREISKAVGIKEIIKAAEIDIADTYAFGDDINDIEMLSAVGCGIAMTPHSEPLEKVAKFFTGSVEEEGISTALTELGLI